MSIGVGIRNMLLGKSALTDLVGDNIQPLVKDQKLVTPCIIYAIGSPQTNNHFSGASTADTYPVTFHVFDHDYDRCVNIMRMLRSSIDYTNGRFGGWDFKMIRFESSQDEFDMQAQLYGQTLTFNMRVKNDPNFGFTLVNFKHVTSGVAKVPLAEFTFEGLFSHITKAAGAKPREQQQFGVLYAHETKASSRAPRGDVSFDLDYNHITLAVARGPRGEINFNAQYTHAAFGIARTPRELVAFLVQPVHATQGAAKAPRFLVSFAVANQHLTKGIATAPRATALFASLFTHETKGVGVAPSAVGLDANYQAVLDFATAQGYTLPSAPQQALQNSLMVALKSAGVYAKMKRFYCFATNGNNDFAKIDWVSPETTTLAIAVNSPTFSTNQGFAGDGATSCLDTQLNNLATATPYDVNSGHIAAYRYSVGSQIGVTFSSRTAGFAVEAVFTAQTAPAATERSNIQSTGAAAPSGATTDGLGFVGISRGNGTQVTTRKGGVSTLRASTSRGVVQATAKSFIFASPVNNLPATPSDEGLSVFSIGGDITAEFAAYETAVTNYINAL